MSKIRGLRWWMIGLIMLGSIINYLTRSTLSVAAPTLLKDLLIFSRLIGALIIKIRYTPFFICLGLLDVWSAP